MSYSRNHQCILLLPLCALIFIASYAQSANELTQPQLSKTSEALILPNIDDVNLLALSRNIKELLDDKISVIANKPKRVRALHQLLFGENQVNIRYESATTKTAQETFDTKSGNCLSHAALYVAAARHVNLKAHFQSVTVPRSWEKEKDYYIVPGHINVRVQLPKNKAAIVEFGSTFPENKKKASKILTNSQVVAEYYSNKGSEMLQIEDHLSAIAYYTKSIETNSNISFVWSNLGVAYKRIGDYQTAERAYLKSIKITNKNLSAINNLYILYQQTHQIRKAKKLEKLIKKINRKNPYYLLTIAEKYFSDGNYTQAISHIKKAIRIKPNEPDFHHFLGLSYFKTNKLDQSVKEIEQARQLSDNQADKDRYQEKREYLITQKSR